MTAETTGGTCCGPLLCQQQVTHTAATLRAKTMGARKTERKGESVMAILVTGGAGYIGSHTCVELQNAGYEVVVLDNLSNASEKSLERVKAITGKEVTFYKGDILDSAILEKIFEEQDIESCIHFAGLKAVGESVAKPWGILP